RSFLKRSIVTTGLVAGGISAGAGTAQAADVQVDPGDEDAYDTIQAGVAHAGDGDTVLVAPGTYEERVEIPGDRGISLVGDPGSGAMGPGEDAPVIDGGEEHGAAITIRPAETSIAETVIDGFEIANVGSHVETGYGVGIYGASRSDVLIKNVHVHHIAGPGVHADHHGLPSVQGWTVRDCLFEACARTGIWLVNVDDAVVRNNRIDSTDDPVSDRSDVWWENVTEDGHPKDGIEVAAYASAEGEGSERTPLSGRSLGVTVEGNAVVGTYDDCAIRLFSYNTTNPPEGTKATLEDVVVQHNTVEITDPFDNEGRDEHGLIIAANASSHEGDDGPVSPAEITAVTVRDNQVSGAGHGYQVFSLAPLSDGGISNVVLADNLALNCERGTVISTIEDGELTGVTIRSSRFRECDTAILVGGNGTYGVQEVTIEDVTDESFGTRTGTTGHESDIGEDLEQAGIAVIGGGETTITGVTVRGYTAPTRPIGMWVRGLEEGTVDGVSVEGSSFDAGATGVRLSQEAAAQVSAVSVEETTFTGTTTGLLTEDEADPIGEAITVHRCDFIDIDEYAVDHRSGGGTLTATCNFWGHPTGPRYDGNRRGQGAAVAGDVDVTPWLPQSFTRVPLEACKLGEHGGGQG
ncbi:MAG: right-handed parallel beta-helix repeat-containing protein, partial [Halobacteriales archaeon]|nr:right-handed parallel beta-helix repeat-containing protein [Halobacteriales archaeon]